MALRLGSVVVNCADIDVMTKFWVAALGLVPSRENPGDDFRVLRGPSVHLSLQVADDPVSCRDQMHVDLFTSTENAEVDRLVALGAVRVRRNDADKYTVMKDPEGNEFCVCYVPDQPGARSLG